MTDSSTSPVPPNPEIEALFKSLSDAIWAQTPIGINRTVNALRSAIASYTLSPEEARTVMDGYHLDPSRGDDFPVLWAKLRRIAASTEEASQ